MKSSIPAVIVRYCVDHEEVGEGKAAKWVRPRSVGADPTVAVVMDRRASDDDIGISPAINRVKHDARYETGDINIVDGNGPRRSR